MALFLGQANLLGSPQATPAANCAAPTPAENTAIAGQAASPEPADFRTQNVSHLRLARGHRAFDIYLFAPDENAEVLSASYCGGEKGARQYSGHFQLLSATDNTIISKLDLDADDSFVEGKPHDGARLLRDPKSGQDLVALYQYGSCTSESVQLFSADPAGRLYSIPFLDLDGHTWKQMLTGSDGAIPPLPDGSLLFCSYVPDFGYEFCEAYIFDGANFREATKWMTRDVASPVKGRNDVGVAARALFDFLSVLSLKEYATAAYYLDTSAGIPGAGPAATSSGQSAAFLEKYCTVTGGQCLQPVNMENKPLAASPGTLLFQVELETADFQLLKIGERSSFEFRVARTSAGFKVLDLPPRLP